MARRTAVSNHLAEIGRKRGRASGKGGIEKLQWQSALQVPGWMAVRAAQMGAQDIAARLAECAALKPAKPTFSKKLQIVSARKKAAAHGSLPEAPVKPDAAVKRDKVRR